MLTLWFSRVGHRFCFKEQEVIVVIHGLGADAAELFVSKVRVHIVLQQANIPVIGRCYPPLLSVFLNEFMEKFADGHIILFDMDILRYLILQLRFSGLCCVIAEAGFPYLMFVFAFAFVIHHGVGFCCSYCTQTSHRNARMRT